MTDNPNIDNYFLQRFVLDYGFPVYFGRDVFDPNHTILRDLFSNTGRGKPEKTALFMDAGLVRANPNLGEKLVNWVSSLHPHCRIAGTPVILPGGETVKNGWEYVHRVTTLLNELAMDRHGFVVAAGGGAFLDMVGFAASIFHRGVKLIRIPTTTLAQNDAGIGVKNGINQYGQKNCIGTFMPPFAVINDFSLLKSLPFSHFISGVAEAFKIALIRDRAFFDLLEEKASLLKLRDQESIETIIHRCALLHLEHIAHSGDPFETGSSRPLDYGHWSAHKIEILSDHTIPHGQAVSVGIALDSYYAWKEGLLPGTDFNRLLKALVLCGLPVWSRYLEMKDQQGALEIQKGLEEFRQHLGGRLTFTMPDGLGRACERHEMDFNCILDGIAFLKSFSLENAPLEVGDDCLN